MEINKHGRHADETVRRRHGRFFAISIKNNRTGGRGCTRLTGLQPKRRSRHDTGVMCQVHR
jgi:hypothetical protein